jgi:hypothetical protein
MRLGAEWASDAGIERARAAWVESGGNLRLEEFLAPDEAERLETAFLLQEFELTRSAVDMYQYWRSDLHHDLACVHPVCALGRWLHGEAPAVIGRMLGVPLSAPPDEIVTCNLYSKGSYLDVHNDFGAGRAVAFVLGLTRPGWGHEEGGWLEFISRGQAWEELRPEERDRDDAEVLLRRGPGWNTLDLFDVRGLDRWHRVTILRTHRLRLTVSGWFYPS